MQCIAKRLRFCLTLKYLYSTFVARGNLYYFFCLWSGLLKQNRYVWSAAIFKVFFSVLFIFSFVVPHNHSQTYLILRPTDRAKFWDVDIFIKWHYNKVHWRIYSNTYCKFNLPVSNTIGILNVMSSLTFQVTFLHWDKRIASKLFWFQAFPTTYLKGAPSAVFVYVFPAITLDLSWHICCGPS